MSSSDEDAPPNIAQVHSASFYVQELVVKALRQRGVWRVLQPKAIDPDVSTGSAALQWVSVRAVDMDRALQGTVTANHHYKRSGLVRKDELCWNLEQWHHEHADCQVRMHFPSTVAGLGSQEDLWDKVHAAMEADPGFWILKPADSSNAQQLKIFTDLADAQQVVNQPGSRERAWVFQKYIENPLLIHKRKFHIRAYALVTGDRKVWLHGSGWCLM
eukprot:TRINITY_DN16720_c0_g2_i1.p1 TRINITY_DN16720_c0_g2~~TRINITY_DN16720_c0_g2_i1.p1  ORF type:complete len:216 (-),score=38.08 TRINITY_DN16720_c0_g2_i1:33-680(-)